MVGIGSTGNLVETSFDNDEEAVVIETSFNISMHSFSFEDSFPLFMHVCCWTNSDISFEEPSKCWKHVIQTFRYLTLSMGLDENSA